MSIRSADGGAAMARGAQRWGLVPAACVLVAFMPAAGSRAEQDAPAAPKVVSPGSAGRAPADAVVLFDGTDLSAWRHRDGRNAEWVVVDGALVVKPGAGGVVSQFTFDAAQVHVEFATPSPAQGSGQGRGNSGVYLQSRYEVQVLDSFENETYPNGQCGAVYGQHVPLVNACRPPGEWQTYDIIFHPPEFDDEGRRVQPATMTVLHNGVLIQDHVEVKGSTSAASAKEGPGAGPLYLQDHGAPVRYRNIWIRPLQ